MIPEIISLYDCFAGLLSAESYEDTLPFERYCSLHFHLNHIINPVYSVSPPGKISNTVFEVGERYHSGQVLPR